MRRLVAFIVSVVWLLGWTPAFAGDPKCESRKLRAWGKLRACEHKERAAERLGRTPDFASCSAKFSDGLLKAGSACRFVDNGDATVTDLDTGLMWQRTDDAGGLTDKDSVYGWSYETAPNGPAFVTFLAGLNACSSFDGATSAGGFAGYCDWRLPQIDEIRGILDCSFGSPCIDETVFGPTSPAYFWSASTVVGIETSVWGLAFFGEEVGALIKANATYTRAVRNAL